MKSIGIIPLIEKNELFLQCTVNNNAINFIKDYLYDVYKESFETEFDDFDFNNGSFEDLIDYFNFKEYTDVIFVVSGNAIRIALVCEYLKDNTNLESVDFILSNNQKKEDTMNTDLMLHNGAKAYISGIYDSLGVYPNILKHVEFEGDISDTFVENIIPYMAINSVFLVDSKNQKKLKAPNIILNTKSYILNVAKEYTEGIEKMDLLLEGMINTGTVDYKQKNIKNGGSILGMNRFNSLKVIGSNVYFGSTNDFNIGSIEDDFNKLRNSVSIYLKDINSYSPINVAIFRYLDVFIVIKKQYKNSRVVIAQTKFFMKEQEKGNELYKNWIGIYDGENYMVYNLELGRLFKVDENFMIGFEVLIKNGKDSDKYNEQERLLKHVK